MKLIPGSVLTALCLIAVPRANAQEFCADIRSILSAAPTEFASLRGAPLPGAHPTPNLELFEGQFVLTQSSACVVAQQSVENRRFSTSYTCTSAARDTDAGLQSLLGQLRDCLDIRSWVEQRQADGRGAHNAQYGLIRLSITRNGALGLALGVEVFRDERGEVMGSPTRGNTVDANGVQRCTPKLPEEIAGYLAMYGSRPGAQRFEDRQFIGYTNNVSSPVVAFATRPSHPAHPALIVRDVSERDGSVYMSASGDFAGDCEAFHVLLREVRDMNESAVRK